MRMGGFCIAFDMTHPPIFKLSKVFATDDLGQDWRASRFSLKWKTRRWAGLPAAVVILSGVSSGPPFFDRAIAFGMSMHLC
jgi:hypothetical protein